MTDANEKCSEIDGSSTLDADYDPTLPRLKTPQAKRAWEEAQARRQSNQETIAKAAEQGGPQGLEPTRFGDWERKGMAVDF